MCSLVVLLALVSIGQTNESPRAVLERAIAAHGGAEKLSSTRIESLRLEGVVHLGATKMPFVNEVRLQLPGKYKSVVTIGEGLKHKRIIQILNGDHAYLLIDNKQQPLDAVHRNQLLQTLQLEQALRLVPLLRDPGFTVESLGEVRNQSAVFSVLRVTGKSQRELKLWFDRNSGLLVKAEHKLDGVGKEIVQEAFYQEYRAIDGVQRAGRVTILRDAKPIMEARLIRAEAVEQFAADEFSPN
jgi:hypothetical protein